MAELTEIRKEINRIDAAIKPLLKERMDCAGEVAAAKKQSAEASGEKPVIFVGPREDEILAAVDAAEHTASVQLLMKEIMGVSRRHQYRILYRAGALCDPYGEYAPNTACVLPLADGKLTTALQMVSRYEVTVLEANQESLKLLSDGEEEMHTLRIQLSAEGMLKQDI